MAIAVNQKSTIRSLRTYLAGQVVDLSRDETLLDELLKCAFCIRHSGAPLGLQGDLEEAYQATFNEIHADFPGLFAQDDAIQLTGPHLRVVHDGLSKVDFDDPQRDIVGDIYEAFISVADEMRRPVVLLAGDARRARRRARAGELLV
jgi:type I restriction enzyme M protein